MPPVILEISIKRNPDSNLAPIVPKKGRSMIPLTGKKLYFNNIHNAIEKIPL